MMNIILACKSWPKSRFPAYGYTAVGRLLLDDNARAVVGLVGVFRQVTANDWYAENGFTPSYEVAHVIPRAIERLTPIVPIALYYTSAQKGWLQKERTAPPEHLMEAFVINVGPLPDWFPGYIC